MNNVPDPIPYLKDSAERLAIAEKHLVRKYRKTVKRDIGLEEPADDSAYPV